MPAGGLRFPDGVPNDHVAASASASSSPIPKSPEAKELQERFTEILDRNTAEILDAMRDDAGHVVLNADDLFKQWPDYARHPVQRRSLGPILYDPAKKFTDRAFLHLLERKAAPEATVVFTAGGGASGKSSILRAQLERPDVDFVVDTTFSNTGRALTQVSAALECGRNVEINYVYRPFEEAVAGMISRALDPENGRVVPIDDMARTHLGAQDSIFAAIETYADDPRVNIVLYESKTDEGLLPLDFEKLISRVLPEIDELQRRGAICLG